MEGCNWGISYALLSKGACQFERYAGGRHPGHYPAARMIIIVERAYVSGREDRGRQVDSSRQ